jgi:hypothetical protein
MGDPTGVPLFAVKRFERSKAVERLERLERAAVVCRGGSGLQPWAEAQGILTQDVGLGLLGEFLLPDV